MRVKVGNEWFSCSPERPIMVELSDSDKLLIGSMASGAHCYAQFSDDDQRTVAERSEWMVS